MARFVAIATSYSSGTDKLGRPSPVVREQASETTIHVDSTYGQTTITGTGLSGGLATTTGVVTGWSYAQTVNGVTESHFAITGLSIDAKAFFVAVANLGYAKVNEVVFAGDDELVGNAVENVLWGMGGDDTINGMDGADTISGGDGRGYLRGGAGNDQVDGSLGFDDAHGNEGDDYLRSYGGDDWAVGGKDNDTIEGGRGNDIVYGNLGNDVLWGDNRFAHVDDNYLTEKAADTIRGGQGDDVLTGGIGDDYLSGDRDSDTITGGRGADTFHSFGEAGLDQITDFNLAEGDRVRLDPGTTWSVEQVAAGVVVNMSGGGRVLLIDVALSSLTGDWIGVG